MGGTERIGAAAPAKKLSAGRFAIVGRRVRISMPGRAR
jgi:hypothetical protein